MRSVLLGVILLLGTVVHGAPLQLYVQTGHASTINSLAFSPDSRLIVTGSNDYTARIWDARSGIELMRLAGHTGSVSSVAFSPDGRLVLTGANDNSGPVRLWDRLTGAQLRVFAAPDWVTAVAFSPDGRFVISGGVDGVVRLWNASTAKELRRFQGRSDSIRSLAVSRDGRFVLTGGLDEIARLWDISSGAEVRRFDAYSGDSPIDRRVRRLQFSRSLNTVAISPDGRTVLTGGNDQTTRLWDVSSGEQSRLLRARQSNKEQVETSAFSRDGRFVVTGTLDGAVRLWSVATGALVRNFREPDQTPMSALSFSPDGRSVIGASWKKGATLWDAEDGGETGQLQARVSSINSAVFSPDGHFLLATTQHGDANLWDLSTDTHLPTLRSPMGKLLKFAEFSPDGRQIIANEAIGGNVVLWGSADESYQQYFIHYDPNNLHPVVSPDGRFVLTGSSEEAALLWDATQGSIVRRYGDHFSGMNAPIHNAVAFSPDGQQVLTGNGEGDVRLWETKTAHLLRNLPWVSQSRFPTQKGVLDLAFSPDGRFIAAAGLDSSARIFDANTSREIRRFIGHTGYITSVVFSPDATMVLTGSSDNTARLWNVATGNELRVLSGHAGQVYSVAFSPDGRFALTGSQDGTCRLWDVASGQWVATVVFPDGGGQWIVVDPEGRFDTNNLDMDVPLHWITGEDRWHPLPLEIFMRDYYTPHLLRRVLAREKLPAVAAINSIRNRVQPEVAIAGYTNNASDTNRVDVSVRGRSITSGGETSGLRDLRLFRNGQMVAMAPGVLRDGSYLFKGVRLPTSLQSVVFTAYAFNSAGIKSATAQSVFQYQLPQAPKRKAFVLAIGESHYQAADCELRYAAGDAHSIETALSSSLTAQGFETHSITLISTPNESSGGRVDIRNALAEIAGSATPDDLFFMSFSGHGYTAANGQFYLLPADARGSCVSPDSGLMAGSISTDDLTEWLRPLDAGEITVVLDSCYSAASVEANGFKPGPLGSRGLGQLAYDKKMRILAASQADSEAYEDNNVSHGLLSYALTELGLTRQQADWRPKDRRITLGEWLAYGATMVTRMHPDAGPFQSTHGPAQIPALFDFSRQDNVVIGKVP